MNESKMPLFEIAALAVGELIVSALTVLVYFLIGKLALPVILGAVLGSAVIICNFVALSVAVNRAVDRIMEERGEGEMDEERAGEFAREHQSKLQNAVKISYIVRTLTMLAALVAAFLLPSVFDVIATLVPLVMFRPILSVSRLIVKRRSKSK